MEEKRNPEIEKIAWQVFLNRVNISFRRELTPDEKQSVIDADPEQYQRHREEATRIYEKKQKALSNKKYPIIDVPASGEAGWMGGAYTLCFVYSKYKGNFVLRGYYREVEEYLKKNYTHYFYNMSLWSQGFNRDIWGFWKKDIGIFEPHRRSKTFKGKDRWKFQVRPYTNWYERTEESEKEAEEKKLYFKRLPKRWIPEFDNF